MGAAHGIEGSFVIVHEFMAKGLGLKGNDLIVYARIFAFANAGKPYCESKAGSAGFCGISKRAAFSVVSRLKARGLIEEVESCDEAKKMGDVTSQRENPSPPSASPFATDEAAHVRRKTPMKNLRYRLLQPVKVLHPREYPAMKNFIAAPAEAAPDSKDRQTVISNRRRDDMDERALSGSTRRKRPMRGA